jgi:hypothetical protein
MSNRIFKVAMMRTRTMNKTILPISILFALGTVVITLISLGKIKGSGKNE